MTVDRLERQLRWLQVYAVCSTVLFLASLGAVTTYTQNQRQRFAEIDVERINVVEPDGKTAMVIANSQRMTRSIVDGREVAAGTAPQRRTAGLIFVDQQGNEVGGLIYGVTVNADGTYNATRSFTIDQHQQDQVIGIQYQDNGRNRAYGLGVWDRPTEMTMRDLANALEGADPSQVEQRLTALAKAKGVTRRPGLRRVFLGSQNGTPALRLSDIDGRERLRLFIESDGTPKLEFLDAQGRVVSSLPAPP